MSIIAVLTGDLINSTRVKRSALFHAHLKNILKEMEKRYNAISETYRGDGFQITIPHAADAFEAVIFLRAGLISHSPEKAERWDSRIASAFGDDKIRPEDMHAKVYISSGRALDGLTQGNLTVAGEQKIFTLGADLCTAFIDDLINSWTPKEAEAMYEYLQDRESHQVIAERLGKKRPTLTLTLQRARYQLVERYIQDMKEFQELSYEC